MFFDTHCHLDAAEFATDCDAVVSRARSAGVAHILLPAVELAGFSHTVATARRYECHLALGIHPLYVQTYQTGDAERIRSALVDEKALAVGEIGLDFFVPGVDQEKQRAVFIEQLKIAHELDLPVLLHVRRALDATLALLRRYGIKKGIVHAFNGSEQQARSCLKQGLLLGFGGAMTQERALNIRRLAINLPLESIVLETDAPDMPPAWRGYGRNEPAELVGIAQCLAGLRKLEVTEIARITTHNAMSLLRG